MEKLLTPEQYDLREWLIFIESKRVDRKIKSRPGLLSIQVFVENVSARLPSERVLLFTGCNSRFKPCSFQSLKNFYTI